MSLYLLISHYLTLFLEYIVISSELLVCWFGLSNYATLLAWDRNVKHYFVLFLLFWTGSWMYCFWWMFYVTVLRNKDHFTIKVCKNVILETCSFTWVELLYDRKPCKQSLEHVNFWLEGGADTEFMMLCYYWALTNILNNLRITRVGNLTSISITCQI